MIKITSSIFLLLTSFCGPEPTHTVKPEKPLTSADFPEYVETVWTITSSARGDFNGDGIEDSVAVIVKDYQKDPNSSRDRLLVLHLLDRHGSVAKSFVAACPAKYGDLGMREHTYVQIKDTRMKYFEEGGGNSSSAYGFSYTFMQIRGQPFLIGFDWGEGDLDRDWTRHSLNLITGDYIKNKKNMQRKSTSPIPFQRFASVQKVLQ